ncbi:MAG TPA: hypothetical protein VD947_01515 [Patescibacteria group bacterium]|nr:hypothetical protein [Patescibacteria group bacterium]
MKSKMENKTIHIAGIIIFIVLIIVLSCILYKQNQLDDRSVVVTEALISQKAELDQIQSQKRLSYDPNSKMLYLPELSIKLPYNEDSASLVYSLRLDENGAESDEVDISSDKFSRPGGLTQLDCTQFLRLKVEDSANPYNPAEQAYTYKLQDGRTLQVYVFSGELEGNHECKDFYEAQQIYPKDYIKAFEAVQSY